MTNHFIAPRLLQLQRQHPGLQIELVDGSREASLSRREADIVLRMSRPHEKGLITRKLGEVTYGLFGSGDYLSEHLPEDRAFLGMMKAAIIIRSRSGSGQSPARVN